MPATTTNMLEALQQVAAHLSQSASAGVTMTHADRCLLEHVVTVIRRAEGVE